MASIKISDLRPSGLDLFGDSESFLDDLSDNDLATINGASWYELGYVIGYAVGHSWVF
jgi:hypothetical protein